MTEAQQIAREILHIGGARFKRNDIVGVDGRHPEIVADYLGLTLTPGLHDKLWALLGAFEDGALSMIAKLPKNENGNVEYGGESISQIFD